MLSVLDRGHHLALGRAVAGQLVCNQNARGAPLLLQQLSQQAFGGPFVPPALHQDVEHDAGLVDRAPQPVLLAGNFDGNLVEVPLVSGIGQPPPNLVGEVLAELERPLPHALVADDDAARSQHLLDHAQAEGKAEIQPNRMADDLGRKPVAGVAGANTCRHRVRLLALLPIRKPVSSQVDDAGTSVTFDHQAHGVAEWSTSRSASTSATAKSASPSHSK